MKKIVILCIYAYQVIFAGFLRNVLGISRACRFELSCSEYAKREIAKHGLIKGIARGFIRILRCQPYVKINYV